MALADEFRNRLTGITSLDEEIATLTESCETLCQEVIRLAGELTESRRPVAAAAEQEMASAWPCSARPRPLPGGTGTAQRSRSVGTRHRHLPLFGQQERATSKHHLRGIGW